MRRKRYTNLDNVKNMKSWDHFVRWQKARRTRGKDYSFVIPKETNVDTEFLQTNNTQISLTWIGHATFLIQIGGLNILTDPVWANRMGFHPRLAPPGLSISQLPKIDVVLISHSHYDHLHFYSIRRLKGNPLFLVPVGLGNKFLTRGFKKVEEFNWWDEKKLKEVVFSFVPAQHWSKRNPWDTNRSHWGGWMISSQIEDKKIYFVGDSGYFSGFKEIGNSFDIDYVLMPIGAYDPEWFMGPQHVSPEEAVQAFLDLQAKKFIPMHYSTFRLADDTPLEALYRLQKEWKRQNLAKDRLQILMFGETLKI